MRNLLNEWVEFLRDIYEMDPRLAIMLGVAEIILVIAFIFLIFLLVLCSRGIQVVNDLDLPFWAKSIGLTM